METPTYGIEIFKYALKPLKRSNKVQLNILSNNNNIGFVEHGKLFSDFHISPTTAVLEIILNYLPMCNGKQQININEKHLKRKIKKLFYMHTKL